MGKSLWNFIQWLRADGCTGLAGMIAYNFFLALPTLLIFIVTVLAFLPIENVDQQITGQLQGVLPSDVLTVFNRMLGRTVSRGQSIPVLLLSLLGTLYIMNNGYAGLIGSLNRIYDFKETRPWLKVRLRALVMSVIASLFLIAAFAMAIVAPMVVSALSDDQGFNLTAGLWLDRVRWPAIVVLAVLGIESTYRYAPCGSVRWRILTPGTVFATGSWLVATLAFGFYVNNYSAYQSIYGGLGSVIVLLTWMWISAMTFLTGAEINMTIREWREKKARGVTRSTLPAPDL
ncbi:MAG: YihY/virulence factor BrkB family protein [Actinobacteria bacterium]|nr:YihY/virulence factor BrkB family protein [Actinomycetota bacterium]